MEKGSTYTNICSFFGIIPIKEVTVNVIESQSIYPSGKIIGIYTRAQGVFVIATSLIESAQGTTVNPSETIVREGDYILAINDKELTCKEDMIEAVTKSEGNTLTLTVLRNETIFETKITPILAKNGEYMLGIWVKDDLAGVGTMTYFTQTGDFAALGHGMGDGETSELLKVADGDIYTSNIVGIQKGERGTPGEIKGVIYYGSANHLGELAFNNVTGIFNGIVTLKPAYPLYFKYLILSTKSSGGVSKISYSVSIPKLLNPALCI